MPPITAYLLYEDVAVALDWLGNAFGFRERMRMPARKESFCTPRWNWLTA